MMRRPVSAATALLALLAVGGCGERPPPPEPAGPSETPVVEAFTERAAAAGLDFSHRSGARGEHYFPEIMGAGVALIDYDGDGDLDVYAIQGGPIGNAAATTGPEAPGNRLYRNDIDGADGPAFTDVTEEAGVGDRGYGMGVATGDVDNDGDTDLYVTNFGPNVLYRNDGDGTFTDVTAEAGVDDPRWSTSAAFFDYDRDGDLDLFVTHYVSFAVTDNVRCTSPAGRRDYCDPNAFSPLSDTLWRNEGGGRFTDVTAESGIGAAFGNGLGVTVADFDRDGWPDIYVANDQGPNQLWMNLGDGRFEDRALISGCAYNADGAAEASMGVTAADYDDDGDDDLFLTHLRGETNTLYRNEGDAGFMDVTDLSGLSVPSLTYTGFGTAWFDLDNDGDLDLFSANGAVTVESSGTATDDAYPYQQLNQLFENAGAGRFVDLSRRSGAAMRLREIGRGAAFGDVDNDGDVDIVVSNNAGQLRLYLNEIGDEGGWLRVRLTGTDSVRDGTGAVATLELADGRSLRRRAHTDGSYLSAGDPRVHFGLGDSEPVALTVAWPSGRVERWDVAGRDVGLALVEGTGVSVEGG
jgi:hypothetical protein